MQNVVNFDDDRRAPRTARPLIGVMRDVER
jgi:hypothetical protein